MGVEKPSMSDILGLSVPDRIRLVQAIWDSIREAPEAIPVTDAEKAELDRRLEAYYKNPASGSPWPEVRKRLTGSG